MTGLGSRRNEVIEEGRRGHLRQRRGIREVQAGAESAARAGEHQHPRPLVGADLGRQPRELVEHLEGHRVEPVRTVQRGDRDARSGTVDQQRLVVHHGASPAGVRDIRGVPPVPVPSRFIPRVS
jgi:hypothetical protein